MHFWQRVWYQPHSLWSKLLWPLQIIFRMLVCMRRAYYRLNPAKPLSVPLIVVGNLTVGGTGKTPLVIYLVESLRKAGFKPGVVSRGYGGKSLHYPAKVTAESQSTEVGDEPLLIVQRTGCPLVVDPDRKRAAKTLLACGIDVIISDDGLQHYRLPRDIEIVVVDSIRQFGNGLCLPAGPLREPLSRLKDVDFTINNNNVVADDNNFAMQLMPECWVNVSDTKRTLPITSFSHQTVHAVAGIGNPERFFASLSKLDISAIEHPFPDHYQFSESDFDFAQNSIVLMTEKDAVKCRLLAKENWWYLKVNAELVPEFMIKLLTSLRVLK